MEIGAARAVLAQVPLSVAVQAELRRRARMRSTHYSTRIAGNRLTLKEAQEVIDERRTTFHGRGKGQQDVGSDTPSNETVLEFHSFSSASSACRKY